MNKRLTAVFFLLSSFLCSFAEDKKQEKLDELLQRRAEYICSKIGLTPEEKEKFMPLYNEYQEKKMDLFEKDNLDRLRKRKEKKSSYTEEEYREVNESYINEKLDRSTLDRIYYEKFREILPESKIFNMFQAERLYKHDLIKQVENKGKDISAKNK